jgi:hypothetical protein
MAHGNVNIINSIDDWEIKLVEAQTANKVVSDRDLNLPLRNARAYKLLWRGARTFYGICNGSNTFHCSSLVVIGMLQVLL